MVSSDSFDMSGYSMTTQRYPRINAWYCAREEVDEAVQLTLDAIPGSRKPGSSVNVYAVQVKRDAKVTLQIYVFLNLAHHTTETLQLKLSSGRTVECTIRSHQDLANPIGNAAQGYFRSHLKLYAFEEQYSTLWYNQYLRQYNIVEYY